MNELSTVLAIGSRDFLKFLRDPGRLIGAFIFPFGIMFLMGGTLQLNLGRAAQFDFISFTFTGVLGMTLFQSTAQGMASLLEDRQSDFAQEMFVSPVSRYAIIFGKVLGETGVALAQALPLVVFALVLRVPLTPAQVAMLLPVAVLCCFMGGSFGLLALSFMNDQRGSGQLFNFVTFPQMFLAGVISPIKVLPWYLAVLSLMSPMRYVVDLARGVVFTGRPDYSRMVLLAPMANLAMIGLLFVVFMAIGTTLFVRRETNR